MLSTLSALYGHLTETGAVAANPAALHRGRLGLSSTARDTSPTVRLTAAQLGALLRAAGGLPHTRDPRLRRLYATRAVAFVALLTLGLRISELVGLNRGDLYRSGGDDVLRVLGKGGHHREVYVTELVTAALRNAEPAMVESVLSSIGARSVPTNESCSSASCGACRSWGSRNATQRSTPWSSASPTRRGGCSPTRRAGRCTVSTSS